MSKDPAFLFYPGDYLQDTQCLSEKSQVSYDRIMCKHMINIPISKEQLNFLTKRLNEDERYEIMSVLKEVTGGYVIEWVLASIEKRRAYSESRRQNRAGKGKENAKNISKSYDSHMENENENEVINKNKGLVYKSINGKTEWKRLQKISLSQSHDDYLACCKWWFEKAPSSYYQETSDSLECDSIQWAKKCYAWLENSGEKRTAIAKLFINFCKPKFKKD